MKHTLLLILVSLILINLNGCGNKTEEKTESTSEDQAKDPENKFSEKNSEEKIDPLSTGEVEEGQLEMDAGLPADFPSDVPQYEKANLIGSLNSSDGMMVTYESSDQVQNIIDFYKAEMTKSGYTVEEGGEIITPGKGGLINWTKSGKSVQIVLGYDKDKGISSFVITYK